MSSTFLTRLRIGEILVDAKGVSRLYNPGPSWRTWRCSSRPSLLLLVIVVLTTPALERPRRPALAQDQGRSLGYSARYHAASLAAVFLALAVGILIGVGPRRQRRLRHRGEPARQPRGRHRGGPRRGRRAARPARPRAEPSPSAAYPALVSDTLRGPARSASIALGGPAGRRRGATSRTRWSRPGAELVEVAVVRRAPGRRGAGRRARPAVRRASPDDDGRLRGPRRGARRRSSCAGAASCSTGCADALFSRSSGEGGPLDGVVIVRAAREPPEDDEGRTDGLRRRPDRGHRGEPTPRSSAVERSDAAESCDPVLRARSASRPWTTWT